MYLLSMYYPYTTEINHSDNGLNRNVVIFIKFLHYVLLQSAQNEKVE